MGVTRLDEYTQFCSGLLYNLGDNPPEYTPELFVRKLLKLEPPSLKMYAGIAVHKAVELMQDGVIHNGTIVDEWTINCNKDIIIETPDCRELAIQKSIDDVTIFGRVDSLDSSTVHDFKTTGSYNYEKYQASYQWRTYLWILNYDRFIYDVAITKTDEDKKIVDIMDYKKIELRRYPNLDNDVENKIRDYVYCLKQLAPLILKVARENNIDWKYRSK